MIQKILIISMLVYLMAGTLLLPAGDFSTLAELPRMYQHCKDAEDPDINIPDFIVEHLLQIDDDMGEAPEEGKNERPHQPLQFTHISAQTTITAKSVAVEQIPVFTVRKERTFISDDIYLSDYPTSVFRPPIIG